MPDPGGGGVAMAAAADAAASTALEQASGAADEDDITHHAGDGGSSSSSDAGEEAPGEYHPQHQHHPAIANGGQGVRPQIQHAGTAPSWSAADERHRAAHAHEDALLRGRAGTPVETQITSDEEAGTGGGGGSSSSSAQQNNNGQGPQQQQQQQQQLTMMGVHRSRAGSAASSTAGSGMGIGMAAAAEEMSVVLPETLRSVLEEVAKCGRSNRLPWVVGASSAEEEIGEVPVPLPFGSLESRTKRKRPMPIPTHTATPSCTVDGGGEAVNGGMGHDDNVYECSHTAGSRKRPRPAPGSSNLAGGTTTYYDNDNDENATETSAPHFRTLRNALQVSLALVLDGAYRVCSERSGVGYRASQAEREAWDRNKGRKRVDETDEGGAPNHIDEDTANGGIGSHAAIENGSSASDAIVLAGPARPVEAQEEDDEEKNSMAVSHSDLAKEMYLDRRTKLLAMLSGKHEGPGSSGRIKSRGALIPPEEYGPVEPPFTIQRICEILVAPTKYYSQTQKLCNALEKLLLIKSPEGFFGGAGAAGADEEDGRYESIPLPEEEELDFRKNAARESPMKMTGRCRSRRILQHQVVLSMEVERQSTGAWDTTITYMSVATLLAAGRDQGPHPVVVILPAEQRRIMTTITMKMPRKPALRTFGLFAMLCRSLWPLSLTGRTGFAASGPGWAIVPARRNEKLGTGTRAGSGWTRPMRVVHLTISTRTLLMAALGVMPP